MKWARDAHRQRAEVHCDRVRLRPDNPTHAVGVVIDQVAAFEMGDDRLGGRQEWTVCEVSTPCGQGCHYCQYAPRPVHRKNPPRPRSRIVLSVSRFAATADLSREAAIGATSRSGPEGWRFIVFVRMVLLLVGSSR